MFGLLLTLCGSVLLALMVAVRNENQIEQESHGTTAIVGKVSPRILNIFKETYLFRTGLIYIALGTLLQIFPEYDLKVSLLNIYSRLIIMLSGFSVILFINNKVVNKIANNKFRDFPPFTLDSPAPTGAIIIDAEDESKK